MAKVKDYQEITRFTLSIIDEIKDDVERLFELGEFSQLGLFDLYQKIDTLNDSVNAIATMGLEFKAPKPENNEHGKEEA